jgi:hypothetical protein
MEHYIFPLLAFACSGVLIWNGQNALRAPEIWSKVIGAICIVLAVVLMSFGGWAIWKVRRASSVNNAARRAAANAATAQATANMARLRNGLAAANARAVNAGNNAAAQVRVNMPNGIPQVAIRV